MKRLMLFTFIPFTVGAQEIPLKIGGFIDTYYAYDANSPKNHEREFTTQPVRHNEFNINLAYIDFVMKQDKMRGRLALQYGHSVTKNTTSEPHDGPTSGPQDTKVFQEAYVGVKMGEKTWMDMGIFLGNIGAESWISKDNWTYSRALSLDYVPYYSSGVRFEHELSKTQSIQFQVLNGWQNMSENNQGKAIGMQYKSKIEDTLTFTYNNFFGDEEVVGTKPRFRAYHNFIFQWLYSEKWHFLGTFDVGHQSQQENDDVDAWGSTAITVRRILKENRKLAIRAEYYLDPHQANVITNTPHGFRVISLSTNLDQEIQENVLWRNEIRGFYSEDKIYPRGLKYKNRLDGFFATSLSLWF